MKAALFAVECMPLFGGELTDDPIHFAVAGGGRLLGFVFCAARIS